MSTTSHDDSIDRREAIRRVSAMLGGLSLVGGSALLEACGKERRPVAAGANVGEFSAEDVAFLDEVADTILPDTPSSPGAKAARTGAFMALMVTDTYEPKDQQTFRAGMRTLDDASRKESGTPFVQATPPQRLALLQRLDREAKTYTDAKDAAWRARESQRKGAAPASEAEKKKGDQFLPDQRKEAAPGHQDAGAAAITADSPPHYFRMMKELALLGYFTSEIGYTKAMRYVESPGRFDPCAERKPGTPSWAGHA